MAGASKLRAPAFAPRDSASRRFGARPDLATGRGKSRHHHPKSFIARDEFEHAIAVLQIASCARQKARTDPMAEERIARMAEGMRNSGEKNHSPLLVGIAEALEDWLISRA